MTKIKIIFFITSVFLINGCSGGGENGGDDTPPSGGSEYLNVQSIDVPGGNTTATLSIQASANCEWIVSWSDDWIRNVSPSEGRGTQNVTITLTTNPSSQSSRKSTLIVSNKKNSITRNVTLTQAPSSESLSLSVNYLNFTNSVETQEVSISSNTHWTITGKSDWMSLNKLEGDNTETITITVFENTSESERNATLTFTGREGSSQALAIKQEGKPSAAEGVSAPKVSNIGKHEAEVSFSYKFNSDVTYYGICYSTIGDPSKEKDPYITNQASSNQDFVGFKLEKLSSVTTYFVRAFVETKVGIQYSNSTSFITESSYPGEDDNRTP